MCHQDKRRVDLLLDELSRKDEIIAALKVYQGVPISDVERRAVAKVKSPLRFFPFRWSN